MSEGSEKKVSMRLTSKLGPDWEAQKERRRQLLMMEQQGVSESGRNGQKEQERPKVSGSGPATAPAESPRPKPRKRPAKKETPGVPAPVTERVRPEPAMPMETVKIGTDTLAVTLQVREVNVIQFKGCEAWGIALAFGEEGLPLEMGFNSMYTLTHRGTVYECRCLTPVFWFENLKINVLTLVCTKRTKAND